MSDDADPRAAALQNAGLHAGQARSPRPMSTRLEAFAAQLARDAVSALGVPPDAVDVHDMTSVRTVLAREVRAFVNKYSDATLDMRGGVVAAGWWLDTPEPSGDPKNSESGPAERSK